MCPRCFENRPVLQIRIIEYNLFSETSYARSENSDNQPFIVLQSVTIVELLPVKLNTIYNDLLGNLFI
jgi:hypothetical protein